MLIRGLKENDSYYTKQTENPLELENHSELKLFHIKIPGKLGKFKVNKFLFTPPFSPRFEVQIVEERKPFAHIVCHACGEQGHKSTHCAVARRLNAEAAMRVSKRFLFLLNFFDQ